MKSGATLSRAFSCQQAESILAGDETIIISPPKFILTTVILTLTSSYNRRYQQINMRTRLSCIAFISIVLSSTFLVDINGLPFSKFIGRKGDNEKMHEGEVTEPARAVSQQPKDDNPPKEGGGDGDDRDHFAVAQLTSNPRDSRGLKLCF